MLSGRPIALHGARLLGLQLAVPTAAKTLQVLGTVAATMATALAGTATAHLAQKLQTCASLTLWNVHAWACVDESKRVLVGEDARQHCNHAHDNKCAG